MSTPACRRRWFKLSKFVLLVLAFLPALDAVGIDLTALAVFGGALGLGFGLQRIASNFISGFIVLFDRSIRPGDVITIGKKFGWVQERRARYVVVKDRDGVERLIPNEMLITGGVINWSYSDRNVRLKIPVSISYDNDPEQALALLLEAAKSNPRVLAALHPPDGLWRQWHRTGAAGVDSGPRGRSGERALGYQTGHLAHLQGRRHRHSLSPARPAYPQRAGGIDVVMAGGGMGDAHGGE